MRLISLFRPMDVRTALFVHVAIPMMLVLGVGGFLLLSALEKDVEAQMQKDLELVARAVRLPLTHAMERDRTGSMMQTLASVFSIGRVYGAQIFDRDGKKIAALGADEPRPDAKRMIEMAEKGERRGEYGRVAGENVFSYFVPLNDSGGRIMGLLQLTRQGREFTENLTEIRRKGIGGMLFLMLLLSGMVFAGHHRAMGTHFNRLAASMGRIAAGEARHRFSVGGPREVAELGVRFNRMMDSLADAEETLARNRHFQKALEEELRQSEKLAALGRLAAGTAHELGAPLSVITGKAQRALRDEEISEGQKKALTDIRGEVERMQHIIRQLLDYSRRSPLRLGSATPRRLAASASELVSEEAAERNVNIRVEGKDDGPPIRVDAVRVEQALINLVRNAVQSSAGGEVRLSWNRDGERLRFFVDDDGPGVPPEIRDRIFDPFFTTKPVGEGTGLGLGVAHTVAEEHDGSIAVDESDLGGARFCLALPTGEAE
ncbi:MAG: sensor histidine kinase [Desulfococcaceae bacterium]